MDENTKDVERKRTEVSVITLKWVTRVQR